MPSIVRLIAGVTSAAIGGAVLCRSALAQGGPAPFSTTKVQGAENVYVFRYGGHLSMFIVTRDGVIATDPISLQRPATVYLEEIRKITDKPVRYVIYSHGHLDHIAGGKAFKDAGARFIAHQNVKAQLQKIKFADVVMPDETIGNRREIKLGGTTLELHYMGRNHSDSAIVMRLPKERILFAVDWIPLDAVMWRNMPDSYPGEWEDGLRKVLKMDFDTMIAGHPGKGGRLTGTKQDVESVLDYLTELSAATKTAAEAGKCFEPAMKEIKLPKFEGLTNYASGLPQNVERYCYYWGRGF